STARSAAPVSSTPPPASRQDRTAGPPVASSTPRQAPSLVSTWPARSDATVRARRPMRTRPGRAAGTSHSSVAIPPTHHANPSAGWHPAHPPAPRRRPPATHPRQRQLPRRPAADRTSGTGYGSRAGEYPRQNAHRGRRAAPEACRGVVRAGAKHPNDAAGRRDAQPERAPSADLADRMERRGKDQRERGE